MAYPPSNNSETPKDVASSSVAKSVDVLIAKNEARRAQKDAQPYRDLDDAALGSLDARLKTEFRQIYPDFPSWQEVWTAFNRGTTDFDLNNKAVAWCIALGWLDTWAHVATDSPEAGALKRFQKARLAGAPGCTVEDTAEYLLWLCPAKGPDEEGVEIAILSESYLEKVQKRRGGTKNGPYTLRHPDDMDKGHVNRLGALLATFMRPEDIGLPPRTPQASPATGDPPTAQAGPVTGDRPAAQAGPVTGDAESFYEGESVIDAMEQ